jgi:PAS domain S-box-containing protein
MREHSDIIDHKQVEEALREGEELFRVLFEHSPDAIFLIDPHGPDGAWRILECNDAACRMNGYERGELVGQDIHILSTAPFDPHGRMAYLDRLRQAGTVHSTSIHRRKDGVLVPIEFSTSLVTLGGRELVLGIDRDVTVRKRAEEALRHANDELELRVLRRTAELTAANERLHAELMQRERAERRLAAQYAVSHVLAEAPHFDAVSERILQIIAEHLQLDLGQLWCVDRTAGVLRRTAAWRSPATGASEFETVSQQTAFARDEGLPGTVWASGEPRWIDDIHQTPNFPRLIHASRAGLRGAFAFPIRSARETFGVMEFFSADIRPPDEDLLRAVAVIGNQAGQYIERRRAEKAARASEVQTRAILEAGLDAIITMDQHGRVTEWNPAAEKTFGWSRETALGRAMDELIIPPPLRQAHRRGLEHYLATGEGAVLGKRVEISAVRAGGAEFPVELAITRIPVDGPPVFTGFVRDITDRKRAEAMALFRAAVGTTLTSSLDDAAVLRSFAELAALHIADWCIVDMLADDGSLRRVAVAHADPSKGEVARDLERHYSPDPLALQGPSRVVRTGQSEIYPDIPDALLVALADAAAYLDILRQLGFKSAMIVPLVARGRTLGAISFVSAESGRRFDDVDLQLVEDLARRTAVAVENARLFEAERRARAEAEETGAMVRRLQNVMDVALAHLTLDDLLRELLGRIRDMLAGDTVAILLLTEDGQRLRAHAAIGLEEEVEAGVEIPIGRGIAGGIAASRAPMIVDDLAMVEVANPILRQKGIQSLVGVPLLLDGRVIGVIHVGMLHPRRFTTAEARLLQLAADRVALAIDHARLYQEAQEGVRLRDEFLSVAAHELRTPVTSLLAYAQVLERRALREQTASERDLRALHVIAGQAERLSTLISTLLDVSRIQRGHFTLDCRPVDLCTVVGGVVDQMQDELRSSSAQHVVTFECLAAPVVVDGDSMRLEQVVQNLVGNAVKYSPDGGLVTVRVEQSADCAIIAVGDQGLGIPQEAQAHLFDRFYRAGNVSSSNISGMGIGLYVVKEIVSRHGGTVEVQSSEGAGSTFRVRIPLKAPASPPSHSLPAETAGKPAA